jgi:hypothetical protein
MWYVSLYVGAAAAAAASTATYIPARVVFTVEREKYNLIIKI